MTELLTDFCDLTDQEFVQVRLTHLQSPDLPPLNGNRTLCLLAMTATGWNDLNHRCRRSFSVDSDFAEGGEDGQCADEELPHSVVQLLVQELELELG